MVNSKLLGELDIHGRLRRCLAAWTKTRGVMEEMVEEITGVKVVSLHHDISTTTAEEVVVFTLAESPDFRETRKN